MKDKVRAFGDAPQNDLIMAISNRALGDGSLWNVKLHFLKIEIKIIEHPRLASLAKIRYK